jgi:hypothetical protein
MTVMIRRLDRGLVVVLLASVGCIGNTLSTVPFHEEPTRPNFALIYIYRQPSFVAGGNAWDVALDDNVVGRIRPNAYFTIHPPPGTHWLRVGEGPPFMFAVAMFGAIGGAVVAWAAHQNPEATEFKARSGEVYYLRLTGTEHAFVPREEAIGTLREMKYDQGY